jgi:hypothetical protein
VCEVEEGRVRLLVDDSLTVEQSRWKETAEILEMRVGYNREAYEGEEEL